MRRRFLQAQRRRKERYFIGKARRAGEFAAVFDNPVNGALEWRRIEALLRAAGCTVLEGSGSSVTFEKDGLKVRFHRPHPAKEALRYRVLDARAFLFSIGVKP